MFRKNDLILLLKGQSPFSIVETYTEEDFRALIEYAKIHKLQSRVLDILQESKVENSFISETYIYDFNRRRTKLKAQLSVLEDIKQYIGNDQYIWIKGIPQSLVVYLDPIARKVGDMDIIVKRGLKDILVDKLLKIGYNLIGAVDNEIRLRYGINFHEIQLRSPQGAFVEIKEYSGEMDVFYDSDFSGEFLLEENVQYLNINNSIVRTSNAVYTCFHMFLTALSNSTTWFYMYDVGLRELYELYIMKKRKQLDCEKIAYIAKQHGVSSIFPFVMKKINAIFGCVFSDLDQSIFENSVNVHPMCQNYCQFFEYLNINVNEEIISESDKKDAYFKAFRKLYYTGETVQAKDYLNRSLLDFKFTYIEEMLRIYFFLDENIGSPKMKILFRVLNNNDEYISMNGYLTDFVLEILHQDEKIMVEAAIENDGKLSSKMDVKVSQNSHHKIIISMQIPSVLLDKKIKRICYNIALNIDNPNDTEMFRITEINPMKNTICMLSTYNF